MRRIVAREMTNQARPPIYPFVHFVCFFNPNGITSFSPELRRMSNPGIISPHNTIFQRRAFLPRSFISAPLKTTRRFLVITKIHLPIFRFFFACAAAVFSFIVPKS